MDRHRYSRRAHELRAFADRMGPLAKMPDRATSADIQLAADLAKKAADDLDELVAATPAGCVCLRIENDNYSYLDYVESCIHHRQYYLLREQLKAEYQKLECVLKNEARMKLVIAALQAQTVRSNEPDERMAKLAIKLADEVLRQLGSEVKGA